MKKLFLMAGFALLAASCSNEESLDSSVNPSNDQVLAPVTVTTTGFEVSQGEFTGRRAESVTSYNNVKALTLAFFKQDGTEVYKCTHIKEDPNATYTTFGEFSTSLPLGSYTMVVIGYNRAQEMTLTSATVASISTGSLCETYTDTQEVSINNTTPVNLTATLQRIVTALAVRSTDNRPEGVTHLRITYSAGSRSFNPTTGFASDNNGFTDLITFGSAVGATTYSGSFLFLATDEQTMNVTIETLDAADGNVLFSKTVTNVPLKRNRITTLQGPLFTDGTANASNFQVESDWIASGNAINF